MKEIRVTIPDWAAALRAEARRRTQRRTFLVRDLLCAAAEQFTARAQAVDPDAADAADDTERSL